MMVLAFDPLLVRVTTKHETIKQFYLMQQSMLVLMELTKCEAEFHLSDRYIDSPTIN
jgi:hypothetical protein